MAVSLNLVMIARNESRTIQRTLDSAKPFVDRMIVLDTGSEDDTVAIAKAAGAEVHSFIWIDDFAAARNAALAHSDADWNLILDADEWIIEGGEKLRASLEREPYIGYLMMQNIFHYHTGEVATAINLFPRLLPRGVRYQGRIHERPKSDIKNLPVALLVQHDGYLKETMERKRGRNQSLLTRALEEAPEDGYLLYHMGKNHEAYEEYESAVPYFLTALANTSEDEIYRKDLVVRTIFNLKKTNRHVEAIALGEDEYDRFKTSADFFFALGDLYLDYASLHPEHALKEILPLVEFSWKRCLEIGDDSLLFGSVYGRGSFLAAENLAHMYEQLGNAEEAAKYRVMAKEMRLHKPLI